MENYSDLISKISDRYNPEKERLVESRMFSDFYSWDADVVKYVRLAMNEVDDSYTQKVLSAGNTVKQSLDANQTGIQYEFQGSVMTRTHIRAASDIDLLTITPKFFNSEISKVRQEIGNSYKYTYTQNRHLQNYANQFSSFQGNSLQVLRDLRRDDENILTQRYSRCDISKAKSIKVHPLQYRIDVDVVVASWFDSFDYALRGKDKVYRGISIYNKKNDAQESPSLPFLSIERINSRSAEINGRLKKMIRFLKNVKEDSGQDINLTSFEINAICYDIPVSSYKDATYIQLVQIVWEKLYDGEI